MGPDIGTLSSFAQRRPAERITKYHAIRNPAPLCSRPNMSSSERLLDRYCNKRLMTFYRRRQPNMMKNVRRIVARSKTSHAGLLSSIAKKYESPDLRFSRPKAEIRKIKKNIYI